MNPSHVAALAMVVVAYQLAPEAIASHFGHQAIAWETILRGACECVLWLFVADMAVKAKGQSTMVGGIALALYGVFEAIQRPICRAYHPMNEIVRLPTGQDLCDAAGFDSRAFSLIAACTVGAVVASSIWRRDA